MKQIRLILCFLILIHTNLSFAQTCNPNIIATTPNSRYLMNADGTTVDKKTGLTWMRCVLGKTWSGNACTGSSTQYSLQGGLQVAANIVFAEKDDWRLPNIKELLSLSEVSCNYPAINMTVFPDISDNLLSSSMVKSRSVLTLDLRYGSTYSTSPDYPYYSILLVRGGQ